MKKAFKWLIYASLLFLGVYLYRKYDWEAVQWPSGGWIWISLPLLFLGFVGQAWQWQKIVARVEGKLPFRQAVISTGLPIFGKYIPGKVWMIMGRAVYVAQKAGIPLQKVTWVSLLSQMITLWVGLILGAVMLLIGSDLSGDYSLGIALALVLLSLFLVNAWWIPLVNRLVKQWLKRDWNLSGVSPATVMRIAPYYAFTWAMWSAGFAAMLRAFPGFDAGLSALAVFPVSASLGIMAILFPGGIGVREGIIVVLLKQMGADMELAVSVSLFQRLWFLAGECFIFVLALAFNKGKMGFDIQ